MAVEADNIDISRVIAVVVGLGLTSIVGWGTSFSAIAVLGSVISNDLNLSREAVFGGITVMLIASGLTAPYAGRLIDREGPRRVIAVGSVLAALALALMSRASGMITFWTAWAAFGAAVSLALSNASVTAIAQVSGPHARRGITGLTILAGITSMFFLPFTAWLEARYGWRMTLMIFSVMHLIICLPLHLIVLPVGRIATRETTGSSANSDASWDGVLPEHARRRAFWLLVTWSCLEGILVWGFNMQAIDVLKGLGYPPHIAIAVWMLSGPSQSAARIAEFMSGGRYPVIMTAVVSAALAPIGFALFVAFGMDARSASVMAVCYGLGHGLFAIARNVLPLRLFGVRTLGETMGRMSLPQNLVNASAPVIFAFILSRYGSVAGLWFAVASAALSLIAVILLYREVVAAERSVVRSAPHSKSNSTHVGT